MKIDENGKVEVSEYPYVEKAIKGICHETFSLKTAELNLSKRKTFLSY